MCLFDWVNFVNSISENNYQRTFRKFDLGQIERHV